MSHDSELDATLSSLAIPLARHANTLLDLRHWAFCPSRAGSCVKAYFELFGAAPESDDVAQSLAALRNWLEARLNIRVLDGSRAVCLETLPLALAGETDLEEFCHTAMQRLREDRVHGVPHLRLEFGFSQDLIAAA